MVSRHRKIHKKTRCRSARFSLIEILIVIGVIVILIAFLVPGLVKAKRRAKYGKWMGYSRDMRLHGKLIAYYNFEEKGGTKLPNMATNPTGFTKYAPEDYTGTIIGGAKWVNGRWPGKGALRFDGGDDHVECGTFNIDLDSTEVPAMTILASFRVDAATNPEARIISKSTSSAEQDHFFMLSTVSSGDKLKPRFRLRTNSGGSASTTTLIPSSSDAEFAVGDWVHVACLYDGAQMKIYVNSVEVGSVAKTGTVARDLTVKTWIGDNPTQDKAFNGVIDEVAVFNAALNENEIVDHFRSGRP